jgi:hypothetical protein
MLREAVDCRFQDQAFTDSARWPFGALTTRPDHRTVTHRPGGRCAEAASPGETYNVPSFILPDRSQKIAIVGSGIQP